MSKTPIILSMFVLLLVPVYASASAQTQDRITILENFGDYKSGEPLFVYGEIANMLDDSFLIMQIFNPQGDICQIQQLTPLSDGAFITDMIPLKGRICGISGEYEIKLFYGDYTKSITFTVSSIPLAEPSNEEMVLSAQELIASHTSVIVELYDILPPLTSLPTNDLPTLESNYVALMSEFFVDDLIIEFNPLIRPAVSSALDSVQKLILDDEITFEIGKSIDEIVFAAVFYYEIGDKGKAIDLLNDAFVDVTNVNPEKTPVKRSPTFDELEDTLLSLMTKSDTVMSKSVKSEIAFIFARGTAPLYVDEIGELVDVLSKSRYLDVVSRKQSDLYRLVQGDWESLKTSLSDKESVDELLALSTNVSKLHQAAILLRELDDVDRFISSESEENNDLANLIQPDWSALERDLALATSVDDILESEDEINQMVQIIDISSRISKSVEISESQGISSPLVDDWVSLLERVENAGSVEDVLAIVLEFDESMTQLREKRNPLVTLEFQYKSMKEKAELQADYENLLLIDRALKIIDTAKQMESGTPSITRIDRIEVLLSWASDILPKIQNDLDSYNKDAYKVRASDILQRAKSLENLVNLSLTKNRFLPNYVQFTETLNEKISVAQNLVTSNDLDQADQLVNDLFAEWNLVSKAYANNPNGSKVGYSVDELKRIEFRKKLGAYATMITLFENSGFSSHVSGYNSLVDNAERLIQYGNFIDAESELANIGSYLSEHLTLSNASIIFDISFDAEKNIWIIDGATEKSVFGKRENLYLTVFNMDGSKHSSLEFTDTKQGNFFTQWNAPTDPGLYIVMLQYKNLKASQIVHIEEESDHEYKKVDLDITDLAREYEELVSFANVFGGKEFYETTCSDVYTQPEGTTTICLGLDELFPNHPRFTSVMNQIEAAFTEKNTGVINDNLDEFKTLIERYLPVRSRVAVVEVTYNDDKLIVSGAVQKTLAFREDLFVNIYDQRGTLVEEIALKDNSSGLFNEVISHPFDSGVYVAQLEYHHVKVTDFFNVR